MLRRPASRVLGPMLAPGEHASVGIVGGAGVRLRLADGREVIDATSQHGAALLGHCHAELTDAVVRAARGPIVGDGYGSPEREEAAAALFDIAFAGEDWGGAVRFCTTGSEANDLALTLAQVVTGRTPIAVRERAYHGAIGLSLAATTHPLYHGGLASRHRGWRSPPPSVAIRQLPSPVCGLAGAEVARHCASEGCDHGCMAVGDDRLAGVAAIVSDHGSGLSFPSPRYQDHVAAAAGEAGALWIQDEVSTGFGRLGRWFAFQHSDTRPDVVTLGKGLTGGAAPGGAVVLSKRLLDRLADERWQSVSTFRNHPLTLAAVRATLRIIQRDDLVHHAAALGRVLEPQLTELAERHPSVTRVRGEGLLWIIEMRGPASHGTTAWRGDGAAQPLAERVAAAALERGVLLASYGGLAVTVAPPLIVREAELETIVGVLDEALAVADADAHA